MRRRPPAEREHRVVSHLGALLDDRGMTLVQLAEATGVTVANLSVLKNDRARAVRYSTLTAVCDALGCQPGDLFSVSPAAGGTQRSIVAHSSAASAMAASASASVTGEKSS